MNSFSIYTIIWLTLSITIFLGGIIHAGFINDSKYNKENILVATITLTAVWPLALAFLGVIGPFYTLYKLAEYLGNKYRALN